MQNFKVFFLYRSKQGNFQICVSVTLMVKNVWCKTNIWTWVSYIFPGYNYRERFFFFPENMMLPSDEKWKRIFLKKNTRKYDIYFKYSENMVFSKRIAPGHDIFCTIWKGGIFFPENVVFFPWTESERGVIFLKKYTETWYFLIDMPPCKKKNQRRSYAAKIHLKVIGILDRHPRKSSSNFLYLHGDLYKRFHILLSSKKTGHVTHRIEVWLLLQFIWLEIFYNE